MEGGWNEMKRGWKGGGGGWKEMKRWKEGERVEGDEGMEMCGVKGLEYLEGLENQNIHGPLKWQQNVIIIISTYVVL